MKPNIRYTVVGEPWEECVTERTVNCLIQAGVQPAVMRSGYNDHPCVYGDLVDRAIRCNLDSDFVVVVASGTFVKKGFVQSVESFCKNTTFGLSAHIINKENFPWPYLHRQFFIVATDSYAKAGFPDYAKEFGCVPKFSVSETCVHSNYTPLWIRRENGKETLLRLLPSQSFLSAFLKAGQEVINVPVKIRNDKSCLYHTTGVEIYSNDKYMMLSTVLGRLLRRTAVGRKTYFQLSEFLNPPDSYEKPIVAVQDSEFDFNRAVFTLNTENVDTVCERHWEIDTLVCVASGIKPWYFAHCFHETLKKIIFIDTSREQLLFAKYAKENFSSASSWSALMSPFKSWPLRQDHSDKCEQVFSLIADSSKDWSFEVDYLQANWVTQTFGIIKAIEAANPKNLFVWWSNVFCNWNRWYIDDFCEVEMGLVDVLRERFPQLVLVNDRKRLASFVGVDTAKN